MGLTGRGKRFEDSLTSKGRALSIWNSQHVGDTCEGNSHYRTRRATKEFPVHVDVALAPSWTDDIRLALFADVGGRDSEIYLAPDQARKVAAWLIEAAAKSEEHTASLLAD